MPSRLEAWAPMFGRSSGRSLASVNSAITWPHSAELGQHLANPRAQRTSPHADAHPAGRAVAGSATKESRDRRPLPRRSRVARAPLRRRDTLGGCPVVPHRRGHTRPSAAVRGAWGLAVDHLRAVSESALRSSELRDNLCCGRFVMRQSRRWWPGRLRLPRSACVRAMRGAMAFCRASAALAGWSPTLKAW